MDAGARATARRHSLERGRAVSRAKQPLVLALDSLADALRAHGRTVVWAHRSREDTAWTEAGGRLHVASARWYAAPEDGAVRYTVDHYVTRVTERARRELGLAPQRRLRDGYYHPDGPRCEQTVHVDELEVFAPWLAAWIVARENGDVDAPSPAPVAWTDAHEQPTWTYGWSVRAWEAVDAHRARRKAGGMR